MGSLEGRVAIVTGAGRGIGQGIALALAGQGARLVLVDLAEAAETAEQLGNSALTLAGDVTSAEDWARIGREIDERFGRLDILVNNAGIMPPGTIDETDLTMWRAVFAVNVEAHFLSAKEMVPRLRSNGWGRIISISSNSIGLSLPGMSAYMASKMAVIGFVRGLANDVAGDNITVNAVLPALTDTPGTRDAPEDFKRAVWEQQAIKRFARPDDIAGPVVLLASEAAAFITGQAIVVDGGQYRVG
jgi:NAD(P)-dependent dehydrogenase (short-subunit alcohol dehydrogenase family)